MSQSITVVPGTSARPAADNYSIPPGDVFVVTACDPHPDRAGWVGVADRERRAVLWGPGSGGVVVSKFDLGNYKVRPLDKGEAVVVRGGELTAHPLLTPARNGAVNRYGLRPPPSPFTPALYSWCWTPATCLAVGEFAWVAGCTKADTALSPGQLVVRVFDRIVAVGASPHRNNEHDSAALHLYLVRLLFPGEEVVISPKD
jgi:hypothetical protein